MLDRIRIFYGDKKQFITKILR